MTARAAFTVALILTVFCGVGAASAQSSVHTDARDITAEAPATATQAASSKSLGATAEADPGVEAKRLYADGKREYAQGKYAEAIALFERAYALSEAPGLLFNMAQAHRLAGEAHCPQALALYKSYLAALPNAENRREVEERVQELRECANQPAAAPPTPATDTVQSTQTREPVPIHVVPLAPASTESARPRLGSALVAGIGAALLIAGGIVYAEAWAKHREAERECPCYPGTYSKWETLTNFSYAAMSVGAAGMVGGVSWWALGSPRSSALPAHAAFGIRARF